MDVETASPHDDTDPELAKESVKLTREGAPLIGSPQQAEEIADTPPSPNLEHDDEILDDTSHEEMGMQRIL